MWKFSRLELYSGLRVKKHSLSIGVFSFLISHLLFEIFSNKLLYVLVVVWFLLGIYGMWIYLTHAIKVSALWMGTEYARLIACVCLLFHVHCMLYSLQYKCTPDLLHVFVYFFTSIVCCTVCLFTFSRSLYVIQSAVQMYARFTYNKSVKKKLSCIF